MLSEKDFIFKKIINEIESGSFNCSAPSNIALVKYWGKITNQIPSNPSVSFTLKKCKTITNLSFYKNANQNNFSFNLLFDGVPKEYFKPKIQSFFERIVQYCPYLKDYHFEIKTQNTFPHSSGIASSASGIAALALNIMNLEKTLNPALTNFFLNRKASFIARLGSGSACRSIAHSVVVWGKHIEIEGSSNLYGIEFPFKINQNFQNFQDTILLVDKAEKKISSSMGHDSMIDNIFAKARFVQANNNLTKIKGIFETGDLEGFITIVESEALTLHSMMMTAMPYYILMKPNTLEIINHIWNFRKETKIPLCFTLDAGANVHILYPENFKERVLKFIKSQLTDYCQNGDYICDEIGDGAIDLQSLNLNKI